MNITTRWTTQRLWAILIVALWSCTDSTPPATPPPADATLDVSGADADAHPAADAATPSIIEPCTALAAAVAVCQDDRCVERALGAAEADVRAVYEAMEADCLPPSGDALTPQRLAEIQRLCPPAEAACLGPLEARWTDCGRTRFQCGQLADVCLETCGVGDNHPCERCLRCSTFGDIARAHTLRRCRADRCAGAEDPTRCTHERCSLENYLCRAATRNRCPDRGFETSDGDTVGLCDFVPMDRTSEAFLPACDCLCEWVGECFAGEACNAPSASNPHPLLAQQVEAGYQHTPGDFAGRLVDICRESCRDESNPFIEVLVPIGCSFNTCANIFESGDVAQQVIRGLSQFCAPDAPTCAHLPEWCYSCLVDDDCAAGEYCALNQTDVDDSLGCLPCDPNRSVSTCEMGLSCIRNTEGGTVACARCESDEQCGGSMCNADSYCACADDAQCGLGTCARDTGLCGCADNIHCPIDSPVCDAGHCRQCRVDDECGGMGPCAYGRCAGAAQ